MDGQSRFDKLLDASSAKLRSLSAIAHQLDIDILKFDENPEDTDLCVGMVQQILEAKYHNDQLVFRDLQQIRMEDERIAEAVETARAEVLTRILGVETDLNRIVNRASTKNKPPARVIKLISA